MDDSKLTLQSDSKIVRKGFAVFNGDFDPSMFTNDLLKFPELLGYKSDRKNLMKFISKTHYDTGQTDWTIL